MIATIIAIIAWFVIMALLGLAQDADDRASR